MATMNFSVPDDVKAAFNVPIDNLADAAIEHEADAGRMIGVP